MSLVTKSGFRGVRALFRALSKEWESPRFTRSVALIVAAVLLISAGWYSIRRAYLGTMHGGANTFDVQRMPLDRQNAPARQVLPRGAAHIRGLVTTQQKSPLAHVTVSFRSFVVGGSVLTDRDGRFDFGDLPVGHYAVSASKAGYVAMSYGQEQPFEPFSVISIDAPRGVQQIQISLPAGAVITGCLVDESGEPLRDAIVSALPVSEAHRDRLGPPRSALTQAGLPLPAARENRDARSDDRGCFRLYGLAAGQYYVVASVAAAEPRESTSARDSLEYVPTYFPGSILLEQAHPVTVAPNGITDVRFAVVPIRKRVIGGWVSTSTGQRATEGAVTVFQRLENGAIARPAGMTRIQRDGSFAVKVTTDGDYLLSAATGNPWLGAGIQNDVQIGRGSVLTNGADVSNVHLVTKPGGVLAGRVIQDDELATDAKRLLRVSSVVVDPSEEAGVVPGSAPVLPDGTFELRNVFGRVVVAVAGVNDVAWVRKVYLNNRDVTDEGIRVPVGTKVDGAILMLSKEKNELVGDVVDKDGKPARNCEVLLFAADRSKWSDALARYTKITRSLDDGRYAIGGLATGDYIGVATNHLDMEDVTSPTQLEQIRHLGTPIRLREGDVSHLRLQLADPVQHPTRNR